jgi:hypothetical protein
MKSVADALRDETRRRVSALTVTERIELALALGARDVELYAATCGIDREEARRRLRAARRLARRPSRCCEELA